MNFFDFNFWQSVVSNFVATIVGAFLGVVGALWVTNHQDRSIENETREKILQLLHDELYSNKEILSNWMKLDGSKKRNAGWRIGSSLKVESWQAFSDGGEIQWVKDPNLLAVISGAYFSLRSVRELSDKYFQMCIASYTENSEMSSFSLKGMGDALENKIEKSHTNVLEAVVIIEKTIISRRIKL